MDTPQSPQTLTPQEMSLGSTAPVTKDINPQQVPVVPSHVTPNRNMNSSITPQRRSGVFPILAFVIILAGGAIAAGYLFLSRYNKELIIEDQPVTNAIRVKKLVLDKQGFLIINMIDFNIGHFRIANTISLPPDTYRDFSVDVTNFSEEVQLRPGALVFGTIIYDTNNDGQIDPEEELSPATKNGKPIRSDFKILAK